MKFLINIYVSLCLLILFIPAGTVSAADYDLKFYYQKYKNREKLTIEEFDSLLKSLEYRMVLFNKALTKIQIKNAGFSQAEFEYWKTQLDNEKLYLKFAFKNLSNIMTNPNAIRYSLALYASINEVLRIASQLSSLEMFATVIGKLDAELLAWQRAFEKAHLIQLAMAKDNKSHLYAQNN